MLNRTLPGVRLSEANKLGGIGSARVNTQSSFLGRIGGVSNTSNVQVFSFFHWFSADFWLCSENTEYCGASHYLKCIRYVLFIAQLLRLQLGFVKLKALKVQCVTFRRISIYISIISRITSLCFRCLEMSPLYNFSTVFLSRQTKLWSRYDLFAFYVSCGRIFAW